MQQISYDSSSIHDEIMSRAPKTGNKILIGTGILVIVILAVVLVITKENKTNLPDDKKNKSLNS
jgi:hypothetical protein